MRSRITCLGLPDRHSVSFFQAGRRAETWKRTHRAGARARLGVDHLLASSAIPFIFPAIKIHREYFGDGSMRQLAPVSPAIHLGAERILVVGAGRMEDEKAGSAATSIRRWRRSPAMPCRRFSSTACTSTWSACSASTTRCR
jgi:predicted acylesterase/phospholipase RssA